MMIRLRSNVRDELVGHPSGYLGGAERV